MKKIFLVAVLTCWGFAGRKAHDRVLYQFTEEFPEYCHEPFATIWGYSGGPVSLFDTYIDGANGELRRGFDKQRRWDAFKVRFSGLDYKYFSDRDCEPEVSVKQ